MKIVKELRVTKEDPEYVDHENNGQLNGARCFGFFVPIV